jgi:capsular polysaccharide biosynthesis protein
MSFLNEVTHVWGHTTLIESDPGEETCSRAIYAPFRPDLYFSEDPAWGIYHRDGPVNQAAAYYRGPVKTLVGQSQTTNLTPQSLPYIDEEFIYGGPFIRHYGHFITATLPRLWHLLERAGKQRRILCHAHEDPAQWFEHDFAREILGALGLLPEHFVRLPQPSVVKRLWIPRPAMEEQNFVHRALDRLGTMIGRALGAHQSARGDQAVYLSKTKLNIGVSRLADERKLEALLAARGVIIAHPQDLPFREQLRLMASARSICGTVGSGFHSSLFLDRPSRNIVLTGNNVVNSNYLLIDLLKRNESVYLYPETEPSVISNKDDFQTTLVINMEAAAEEFAALI